MQQFQLLPDLLLPVTKPTLKVRRLEKFPEDEKHFNVEWFVFPMNQKLTQKATRSNVKQN